MAELFIDFFFTYEENEWENFFHFSKSERPLLHSIVQAKS